MPRGGKQRVQCLALWCANNWLQSSLFSVHVGLGFLYCGCMWGIVLVAGVLYRKEFQARNEDGHLR